MHKLVFTVFALFLTACASAPATPPAPARPAAPAAPAAPGTMRDARRGEMPVDVAHTMKKNDFSPADRAGLTLVFFSKAVCEACAKQAPAWEFASAHVPEGARMKKVLEHEVDLDWYEVTTHPTFILFRDGREIWRFVGIAAAYQLTDAIKRNRHR